MPQCFLLLKYLFSITHMLFTYMIRIVLPLNSISSMIIDEIITFITSSKLLLQICDICFNHGLIFEAFSLLLISYGSFNPFRLYHVYTLWFNFLRKKSICHTSEVCRDYQ